MTPEILEQGINAVCDMLSGVQCGHPGWWLMATLDGLNDIP